MRFRDNIFEILDVIHPKNSEDREYADEENQYFEKILDALKELEEWKQENKFYFWKEAVFMTMKCKECKKEYDVQDNYIICKKCGIIFFVNKKAAQEYFEHAYRTMCEFQEKIA